MLKKKGNALKAPQIQRLHFLAKLNLKVGLLIAVSPYSIGGSI